MLLILRYVESAMLTTPLARRPTNRISRRARLGSIHP